MKRLLTMLLALTLLLTFAACSDDDEEEETTEEPAAEDVADDEEEEEEEEEAEEPEDEDEDQDDAEAAELVVFAAASMEKALTEIAEEYQQETGVEIVFTFDSSGTLKTQIEEGAEADIFISAGQKQMNQLDIEDETGDNEDELDFVLTETRYDLLENEVVLVVPVGNPADIQSYDDLGTDKLNLLCIGNEDVPVGQYAAEILTYMDLIDDLESAGKITYGTNTTEVTTQVAEAVVDAGIVYRTDVASAVDPDALEIVDSAPEGSMTRAIYPAAVLNTSSDVDAATAFLEYLQSDAAKAVLERYGFTTDF